MHEAIHRGDGGDGLVAPVALRHIPALVGTLGSEGFASGLIGLLSELCHADHCTLFRITEQSPCEVVAVSRDGTDIAHRQSQAYLAGSYWRYDEPMTEAMASVGSAGTTIYCSQTRSIANRRFRDLIYNPASIRDRVLLCGGTKDMFVGISILWDDRGSPLSERDRTGLQALSETLVSLVSKHVSLVENANNFSLALTSLPEIQATLEESAVRLPRREAEVCARILYGMSSAGIALDLEIGEETVATYRKRTYQRLEIATQRELLLWYVREWGGTRGRRLMQNAGSTVPVTRLLS